MDLDKLRTFYYVVREGGIQGAEKALNLSASSISRQISSIEQALGLCLFERTRSGLKANESGRHLYAIVEEMMEQVQLAQNVMKEEKNLPKGVVTCVGSRALGENFLMPRLLGQLGRYPDLLVECVWDDYQAFRFDGLFENPSLYITSLYRESNCQMIKEKVGTYSLKAVASKGYLEVHGAPLSAKDLNNHKLIGYRKESCRYLPEEKYNNTLLTWGAHQPRQAGTMVCDHTAALAAVRGQAGIALLPDYMIREAHDLAVVFGDLASVPWAHRFDVFVFFRSEYKRFARIMTMKSLIKDIFSPPYADQACLVRGLGQQGYVSIEGLRFLMNQ